MKINLSIKRRCIFAFIQIILFLLLHILSATILNNIYIFGWIARELYLCIIFIWIPCVLLTLFNRKTISIFLTIGNIFGMILGQLLGDYIIYLNNKKIVESMSVEQKYYLKNHYGVFIWIVTILCFLFIGIVIYMVQKYRKKHISEEINKEKYMPNMHVCELKHYKPHDWKDYCPLHGDLSETQNECEKCIHFITIDFDPNNPLCIKNIWR